MALRIGAVRQIHSLTRRTYTNAAAPVGPKVLPKDAFAYCQQLIRQHDYDHYLGGLLYPSNIRPGYWAIRALCIELSAIRDSVSSPHIGLMRLQFWRDAIQQLYDGKGARQHPVLVALDQTLAAKSLSHSWFRRIMNEREKELQNVRCQSVADVEGMMESLHTSAMYLQLELLGVKSLAADHTASHVGKAYGIVALLRSTPYHASKRVGYFPAQLFAKYGVSEEELFRKGPEAAHISDMVYDMASVAYQHLDVAQEHINKDNLPAQSITAMLAGVSARAYLKKLQKVNFNVFDPSLTVRPWLLPLWFYTTQRYKRPL